VSIRASKQAFHNYAKSLQDAGVLASAEVLQLDLPELDAALA